MYLRTYIPVQYISTCGPRRLTCSPQLHVSCLYKYITSVSNISPPDLGSESGNWQWVITLVLYWGIICKFNMNIQYWEDLYELLSKQ